MSKAKSGAMVLYCGHKGVFPADIYRVGNVNVVRATAPVDPGNILREHCYVSRATHHLVDMPSAGFWRPDLGVFVVPEKQVREL